VQPVPSEYVILVVPTVIPVTIPEREPMVATAVVPEVQLPPTAASDKVIVLPTHTVEGPRMAVGEELTVSVVVAMQPPGNAYVIIVVPIVMPHAVPEEEPIVATDVLLLVHMPPGTASVNAVQLPAHTPVAPVMGDGEAKTVTVVVTVQPVDNEYEITEVPALTPHSVPVVAPMVATAVFELLQVPPATVLLRVVHVPAHKDVMPVMAAGAGETVAITVAVQPPLMV
jgi:hypothetical protein